MQKKKGDEGRGTKLIGKGKKRNEKKKKEGCKVIRS
jgi:hypothetical protein